MIELLVVVTVIVVLLAMLTPALDQAIYQAELAVCSAQMHSIGQGVSTYAASYARRYPLNPRVEKDDADTQPHDLAGGNSTVFGTLDNDMRPALRSMFNLKIMVDPLSEPVDLDTQGGDASALQIVMGSYHMWFGWKYRDHRKMAKIGDKFAWTGLPSNPPAGAEARTESFKFLASDRHHIKQGSEVQSSHPDKDGNLQSLALQDAEDNPWIMAFSVTYSFWFTNQTDRHGPIDLNHLYADGSVTRMEDVEPYDERTFPVPERMGKGNEEPQHRLYIPLR